VLKVGLVVVLLVQALQAEQLPTQVDTAFIHLQVQVTQHLPLTLPAQLSI
jgi:hypothetical protein